MNQAINTCITGLNNIGRWFCDYGTGIFIQSGILIILLLIIDLLMRKRVRATFRYWIWMLVLLKLMLPPTFSLPTGIGHWFGDYLPARSSITEQVSSMVRLEPAGAPAPEDSTLSAEIPQIHSSQINPEPAAPAAPAFSDLEALTWQAVVFVIWLVGATVLSVLLIHRMLFVRRLIAQSEPAKSQFIQMLDQCRQQLGIKRKTELRLSGKLQSPAVCGFFRPVILMPAGLLEKLSPDKLRAVLIHELAHIKRGDLWINCIQAFLQIIYFYNPFVWLANAVVRRIREQAVDEMVLVALGDGAKDYSNTLIDIAEMTFFKTILSLRLIGVVESKKALNRRIRHMLDRPIPKSAKLGIVGLIAIFITGAILLPMAKAESGPPELVIKGTVAEAEKVPPVGDYALEFDGVDDFLEIHASKSLRLGRYFTIQMWVKPEFPDTSTPDKDRNLLSKGGYISEHPDEKSNRRADAYGFGFKLRPEDNSMVALDMSTANGGIYTSTNIFSYESGWQHLVISSRENSGASGGINYIHTSQEAYKPAPKSNIIVGGKFLIPMGNYFKGQIAELRIWNRALSFDEIAHFKTITLTGNEPNLVGCWIFEHAEGQRAIDISPYKNHARLGSTYGVDNADPAWVRINTEKENVKNPDVQVEDREGVERNRVGNLLPVYEVNRSVADFPEKEDFSTPEAAYAAINRVSANGEDSAWVRVSVKKLADRLALEKRRGKKKVDPEWARVLLNVRILEVRIWKGKYAMVIAELLQEFSSKKIISPIDLRSLEFENGRWLNAGNARAWTIEEGRAIFTEACEYREGETERELIRNKRINEVMEHPEEIIEATQQLFDKIRKADYEHILSYYSNGKWKQDGWKKFPTLGYYMVHTDYPSFAQWCCETFRKKPIVSVELGGVFIGDEEILDRTGWPTVPYKLTLKDGTILDGNLAFEYNSDGGKGHWHGMEGIDWHLQK